MKNLNLNAYGVEAMPRQEMQATDGGQVMDYATPVWNRNNHGNEIYYAMEAVVNLGVYAYNGVAGCVNGIASLF